MNKISNQRASEDEIDLIEITRRIFKEKLLIFRVTFIATIIGIIYSLSLSNLYTSSTTFIPQLSSGVKSGGSSLTGLASLAGINVGSMESSSGFPASLYPQVIESFPFKLELLSSVIVLDNKTYTVREYFLENNSSTDFLSTLKKYTIGLPSQLFNKFTTNEETTNKQTTLYQVSDEDFSLFGSLSGSLILSMNEKEGFITLSFKDENKFISAQITQIAQNLLQEKIIEFKNKSSKETLDFALKQYEEIKEVHEELQDERAIFMDKNINISSSLFQNKLSRLESELNISESILLQLANQTEQARLQVNKDTPVFTTIQPVTIPLLKSEPSRLNTVLKFFLTSLIFSIMYIIIKNPIISIIKTLKS